MMYVQPRQYVLARSCTMLQSSIEMLFASRFGMFQDGDLGLTDVTSIYTKQKQNIQKSENINAH